MSRARDFINELTDEELKEFVIESIGNVPCERCPNRKKYEDEVFAENGYRQIDDILF